jgi:predicted kinase
MTTLYITRGLPASGKTTWAIEQINARRAATKARPVRINRDTLRYCLHGKRTGDPAEETQVTAASHTLILEFLNANTDVYCDDTNLNPRDFDKLTALAAQAGANVVIHDLRERVSLAECLRRNSARPTNEWLPNAAIRDMHARYIG